jgi:hypothetical protein
VLADEGSGSVVERDTHGVPWDHRKYILEVRPVGQAVFRVEVRRANAKQQRAAEAQALLNGAPVSSVVQDAEDDEPVSEDY